MVYTNLDIITRRTLLEKGLPIHYYAENLYHASACLRELSFDTLKIVNTQLLPINSYNAIDLPDDYVDDVAVCFNWGEVLQPIPHKSSINPLRIHNPTTGDFTSHTNTGQFDNNGLFYGMVGWTWYWNINDYGEPTGRLFGANGGGVNGYKVIKERRQIQLTGDFPTQSIVLQYISDGQTANAASLIDPQAISTIQAYQSWKSSPNANNPYSPEAANYNKERRKLRARLNPLTTVDIKQIIRQNYTAAINS